MTKREWIGRTAESKLERGCYRRPVSVVVVRVRRRRKVEVLVSLVFVNVVSKLGEKSTIVLLDLAACLRVTSRREEWVQFHQLTYFSDQP